MTKKIGGEVAREHGNGILGEHRIVRREFYWGGVLQVRKNIHRRVSREGRESFMEFKPDLPVSFKKRYKEI